MKNLSALFVLRTLPRAEDLVVRVPIGSGLEGLEKEDGLEFRDVPGPVPEPAGLLHERNVERDEGRLGHLGAAGENGAGDPWRR